MSRAAPSSFILKANHHKRQSFAVSSSQRAKIKHKVSPTSSLFHFCALRAAYYSSSSSTQSFWSEAEIAVSQTGKPSLGNWAQLYLWWITDPSLPQLIPIIQESKSITDFAGRDNPLKRQVGETCRGRAVFFPFLRREQGRREEGGSKVSWLVGNGCWVRKAIGSS